MYGYNTYQTRAREDLAQKRRREQHSMGGEVINQEKQREASYDKEINPDTYSPLSVQRNDQDKKRTSNSGLVKDFINERELTPEELEIKTEFYEYIKLVKKYIYPDYTNKEQIKFEKKIKKFERKMENGLTKYGEILKMGTWGSADYFRLRDKFFLNYMDVINDEIDRIKLEVNSIVSELTSSLIESILSAEAVIKLAGNDQTAAQNLIIDSAAKMQEAMQKRAKASKTLKEYGTDENSITILAEFDKVIARYEALNKLFTDVFLGIGEDFVEFKKTLPELDRNERLLNDFNVKLATTKKLSEFQDLKNIEIPILIAEIDALYNKVLTLNRTTDPVDEIAYSEEKDQMDKTIINQEGKVNKIKADEIERRRLAEIERKRKEEEERKEKQKRNTENSVSSDALVIESGALTILGEGQSGYIHWPGGKSGVTVGSGYDIGSRRSKDVYQDLIDSGMDSEKATQISKGAGLKGQEAKDFVSQNKSSIGKIEVSVMEVLLRTSFPKYEEEAKNMATSTTADSGHLNARGREIRDKKAAGTYVLSEKEWNDLHPAMVELLTDMKYHGGYYAYDRISAINSLLKANSGNHLEQFKAVRDYIDGDEMEKYTTSLKFTRGNKGAKETFYGQEINLEGEYRRDQIRVAYLNQIISHLEQGKEVVVSKNGEIIELSADKLLAQKFVKSVIDGKVSIDTLGKLLVFYAINKPDLVIAVIDEFGILLEDDISEKISFYAKDKLSNFASKLLTRMRDALDPDNNFISTPNEKKEWNRIKAALEKLNKDKNVGNLYTVESGEARVRNEKGQELNTKDEIYKQNENHKIIPKGTKVIVTEEKDALVKVQSEDGKTIYGWTNKSNLTKIASVSEIKVWKDKKVTATKIADKNKEYAELILEAEELGIITFSHTKVRATYVKIKNLEKIGSGKQYGVEKDNKFDPKTEEIKILQVIVHILRKEVERWEENNNKGKVTDLKIGSFMIWNDRGKKTDELRDPSHGAGRAIDINIVDMNWHSDAAVDVVIRTIKQLPKLNGYQYGFGLPHQGDFFNASDKIKSKKLLAAFEDMKADGYTIHWFPDADNHLHIQMEPSKK